MNCQIGEQHFRNLQGLEARVHHPRCVALRIGYHIKNMPFGQRRYASVNACTSL